jgi:hypothetical protein
MIDPAVQVIGDVFRLKMRQAEPPPASLFDAFTPQGNPSPISTGPSPQTRTQGGGAAPERPSGASPVLAILMELIRAHRPGV